MSEYYKITHKESRVIIEISAPFSELEKYQKKILEDLNKNTEISGFRKGHTPDDVLIKHLGEAKIINHQADAFLTDIYPKIIYESKVRVVSRPEIQIKKLVKGNPFEATLTVDILPSINLGDYKKIAKENKLENVNHEVSQKEIDDFLLKVKSVYLNQQKAKNPSSDASKVPEEKKPEDIELTDEMIKSFGPFSSVAEFKKQIEGDLKKQKEMKHLEKSRTKIFEALIKENDFEVPQSLIEIEKDRTIEMMKADITRMGLKFEDYLKNIGKSVDSLRAEAEPDCIKRMKVEFILRTIADLEKVEIEPRAVEEKIKEYKAHNPGGDDNQARIIIEGFLRNQKVFEILEK